MQQKESLGAFKNWFSPGVAAALGARITAVHPAFDMDAYQSGLATLTSLELKDRVRLISIALHAGLRSPFPEAAAALTAILGPPVDPSVPNSFQMIVWPLTHYVGRYGLEHFDASMAALHAMTQRATAEFDIRPFLIHAPERTLSVLARWVEDPSEHVRRLVSEGTRTRLPWGGNLPAFIADPSPVLPLLERLRDDRSPYVRRSVANNLNDIARDHPALVVDLAARWMSGDPSPERRSLVARALRSRIKAGDPAALAALGHGGAEGLEITGLRAAPTARIGEALTFRVDLHNRSEAPVSAVVDYRVHHAGARTERAPKVFKLRTLTLPPNGSVSVEKKHSLKVVTTRTLYPGTHRIEVQVNGQILGGFAFELIN